MKKICLMFALISMCTSVGPSFADDMMKSGNAGADGSDDVMKNEKMKEKSMKKDKMKGGTMKHDGAMKHDTMKKDDSK